MTHEDNKHLEIMERIADRYKKPTSDRALYTSIGAGVFCLLAMAAMIAAALAEYQAGGLAL